MSCLYTPVSRLIVSSCQKFCSRGKPGVKERENRQNKKGQLMGKGGVERRREEGEKGNRGKGGNGVICGAL